MFRRLITLTCFVALTVAIFSGYKRLTRGFRYPKIYADFIPKCNASIPKFSKSELTMAKSILTQSYRFLDRGTQCYVFESKDGKYVLKFFRFDRMKPAFWLQCMPSLWSQFSNDEEARFYTRLDQTIMACNIAYKRLKNETGIIYMHLDQFMKFDQPVVLIDALGRAREIDLNACTFILQKKVEPLKSVMKRARDMKNTDWQRSIIRSFFKLLVIRSRQNVCNTDPNVFHNFGYAAEKVYEIDFGDYTHDSKLQRPDVFCFELEKYAQTFRKWLQKHIPEEVGYFDSVKEKVIEEYMKGLPV